MKSRELLHLQQQFLKSLHCHPSPWLLAQIQPARGFSGSDAVLSVYLQRAVKRTVDPLREIYAHLRWLIGDQSFEQLVDGFYAASLGEPLEAGQMATEFATFVSELNDDQLNALMQRVPIVGAASTTCRQILVAVIMFDWRWQWVKLAPRRDSRGVDEMLRDFQHRNVLAARPRVDYGTRLMASRLDLQWLLHAAAQQGTPEAPVLYEMPQQYVLYLGDDDTPVLAPIEGMRQRLLSLCDGSHTLFSLIYEQSLYELEHEAVVNEIQALIRQGLIVELQHNLVGR